MIEIRLIALAGLLLVTAVSALGVTAAAALVERLRAGSRARRGRAVRLVPEHPAGRTAC